MVIDSEIGYSEAMERVVFLMDKGRENLSIEELHEMQRLAEAAEDYDKQNYILCQ
jgi:hypothetical protein